MHRMKFFERLFDVSSILAIIGFGLGTLIICGVGAVCSWKILF